MKIPSIKIPSIKFPSLTNWWTPSPVRPKTGRNLLEIGMDDPLFPDRIRGLRAKFEYTTDARKCRIVGITSSIAGEGKTLTCAHLAASLAKTGRHKVLLVDMDIRKADLTRGLFLPRGPGLTEYLYGKATIQEIVRSSRISALNAISAGAEVSSPTDLLSGGAFRDFLNIVRDRYDIILLDTPPLLPVADTISVRELLEGFVFVFRASYTPVAMFRQATEEMGKEKILGIVINAVEPEEKRYIDRYYGYYYSRKSSAENIPA